MRALLIFLFFSTWLDCGPMSLPNGCWLPETDVLSLSLGTREYPNKMLNPFANILIKDKEIHIKFYENEAPERVQVKYVDDRAEILNVASLIDPDYFDLEEVKATKYFLSFDNNGLILTIEKGQSKGQVRFLKEFREYQFKSYHDAVFRLQFSRKFYVKQSSECLSFSMDGAVQGFSKWSSYELLRDHPYLSNGKIVTLVKFIGTNVKQEYAVEISEEKMMLYQYRKTKYDITLSAEPMYEFSVHKN